jgi:hypothetical protein
LREFENSVQLLDLVCDPLLYAVGQLRLDPHFVGEPFRLRKLPDEKWVPSRLPRPSPESALFPDFQGRRSLLWVEMGLDG